MKYWSTFDCELLEEDMGRITTVISPLNFRSKHSQEESNMIVFTDIKQVFTIHYLTENTTPKLELLDSRGKLENSENQVSKLGNMKNKFCQ